MGVIRVIIARYDEKKRVRNFACDECIEQMDAMLQEAEQLFSNGQGFIESYKVSEWVNRSSHLVSDCSMNGTLKFKKARNYKKLLNKQIALQDCAESLNQRRRDHNRKVLNGRIQTAYTLIGDVEGRKLDKQQMACIVKNVHNHLVIAGAGTGKTTTIVGKIKYLLKSGECNAEDILVLSFTNASAGEMSQRINQETGCNIAASTFHKLGLNIIAKVDGIIPKITQLNMKKFINEQIKQNMQSDNYLDLISSYLWYDSIVSKDEFNFRTQEEYEEHLKQNPPTTIKGEIVKSYGEMDIANFLLQNGVEYIYEDPYKIDTRTDQYSQYKPDFYLPDYDIYIEYFGINKDGEVPSYFKGKNGRTATQVYQESMRWKREIHGENKTIMIECYAYEKLENVLLLNLKKRLLGKSVCLVPKTTKEIWEQVTRDSNSVLDGIVELVETVINLIKCNKYTIPIVRQLNIGRVRADVNEKILSLIEPVYDAYCSYLNEHKEIDFNDMINMATLYVEQGKYINTYKHVIIDEYQDISKARFALMDSMRKSNDFDLFCVGDDWQSIYRFAGSDISFILDFSKYWGPAEISKIETTYRFTKGLIDISGKFIMQNPLQIKKLIKGEQNDVGFAIGEINGYREKNAIDFMVKKLEDLPKSSCVFFIGRYLFDIDIIKQNQVFECRYNKINGLIDIICHKRTDLKINFVTAHKAKGLQADYVFIINNKKSRMGFPSKIQDSTILEILLDNYDSYPHAEERRLFYVAMTRARKKVFLVTVNSQESEFVLELKKWYGDELKQERFECPLCGGRLFKKVGPYGEFLGCSNFKAIGCTYKRKLK